MSKKILLVGCGQLGSRHLQAMASLSEVASIDVVDPFSASLETGKKRLAQTPNANSNIQTRWETKLDKGLGSGDLCVVATLAQGRVALIGEIIKKLNYKNFLIEKIVAPSIKEYRQLLNLAKKNHLKIWVNCKSRGYAVHQYIKSKLPKDEPIVFSAVGGNHGLATNGIHEADLFCFHDDATKIIATGSDIDNKLHAAKRGQGIYDLSGTLTASSKKGSRMIISFAKDHMAPDQIAIMTSQCRFLVDHLSKAAWESYPQDNWQWKKIDWQEDILVSHMTKSFVVDILGRETCTLPTLEACFPAHEYILNTLQPHFNRLLKRKLTACPVT